VSDPTIASGTSSSTEPVFTDPSSAVPVFTDPSTTTTRVGSYSTAPDGGVITSATSPASSFVLADPDPEPEPASTKFDVGDLVEFQTTDAHTGRAVRGVGLVRGHQQGEEGTLRTDERGNQYRVGFVKPGTLVVPLSSDTFVLDDDEFID
jgi:plastocyanin